MGTPRHYRLVVAGELDTSLCDHYGGSVTSANVLSIYEFCVADQTGLHGILAHLRDFDIPIVQLICTDQPLTNGDYP